MFSALCRRLLPLALGTGFVFAAAPAFSALGDTASSQARHIATVFPGRMTGTPPEMLSADYLRQQFAQMGYQSDVRSFNTRYIYTDSNQRKNWHNATGSTVIAAHEGKVRQQIIIMAHLDTYAPQSDKDVENNLGGLTLQGIDDNAMGLGVLLELAEHLQNVPTRYGIRFIATSGEEEGRLGAQNLLQRMSEAEKKNTLLVINLDNLVVGDKLYFNSGRRTPASVRKLTRDRALAIARSKGIAAYTNPGLNPDYPKGTSCCNDASVFDNAGIPCCRSRRLTGHSAKKMAINSGRNPAPSRTVPAGTTCSLIISSISTTRLPGRIEHRGREVVKVMLPLVKELAKVEKPSSLK